MLSGLSKFNLIRSTTNVVLLIACSVFYLYLSLPPEAAEQGLEANYALTKNSENKLSAQVEQSENALRECQLQLKTLPYTRQLTSTEHAVCFVGLFVPGTEDEIIDKFHERKILVIKSTGGFGLSAARLGMYILDKNINVVVLDYCLSACANWVFLAGATKFVPNGSFVAWHGVPKEPDTRTKLLDHNGTLTSIYQTSKNFFDRLSLDRRLAIGPDRINSQYSAWHSRIKNDGMSYWTWSPTRLRSEFSVKNIIYYWYPKDEAELSIKSNNLGINLLIDPP